MKSPVSLFEINVFNLVAVDNVSCTVPIKVKILTFSFCPLDCLFRPSGEHYRKRKSEQTVGKPSDDIATISFKVLGYQRGPFRRQCPNQVTDPPKLPGYKFKPNLLYLRD